MSKRVPVHMSVQEMTDAREALQAHFASERDTMLRDETKRRIRMIDMLHEEIERNTEPSEATPQSPDATYNPN